MGVRTQVRESISSWRVAATYIGTVVGAGFASGQEILQFFGYFGVAGGLGAVAISTAFLVVFGMAMMLVGHRVQAVSHRTVVREVAGPVVGTAIDGVITFFLFGAFAAMAAGSGAVFQQAYGISALWGSFLMAGVTVATVLTGLRGVVKAISVIVPFLIMAVLGVSVATLLSAPLQGGWSDPARAPLPYWPLSGVAYASFNLVLAIAILGPLGRLGEPDALRKGALLGGVGLGLGAAAIVLAILSAVPGIAGFEVPVVVLADRLHPLLGRAYSVVLLAEVYSTAVGSLYGFGARLTHGADERFRAVVALSGGAGFAVALVGFSELVSKLYTAVGIAGFLLLGSLAWSIVQRRIS